MQGHDLAFRTWGTCISKHGRDWYLEAKGSTVHFSETKMFTEDRKFMDLVYQRMYMELNGESYNPGMKIERKKNEGTGEYDIWITYPPIHEKVRNFTGSSIMMWDDGTDKAIDFMEKLEKEHKVVPSDSIQSLKDSRSKILTHNLFTAHGVPTPDTECFPYDRYDESTLEEEMRTALKRLGNPPWYMKADYGDGGKAVRRVPDMAHDIEDYIRGILQDDIHHMNHPWTITVTNKDGVTSREHIIPDIGYSVREDVKAILTRLPGQSQ